MANTKTSLLKIYGFAVIASIFLLALVGIKQGFSAFVTVLILAGLEVTFSFDNAIINAKILQRMNRAWQTAFMTIGIIIAVFVVRVLLPVVIVSLTTSEPFGHIVQLVVHNPQEYTQKLQLSQPLIATFGGLFLLMIFLEFMFTHRQIKWLKQFETASARLGRIKNLSLGLGALAVLLATFFLADTTERLGVLLAGCVGLLLYLLINWLDSIASLQGALSKTAKLGFVGFLYLELIDASFSLDGVIGAFAISKSVLLIGVGLGIGALFVRSMTVHLLRNGVLAKYIYLEHGAHYAIGLLALLMLISVKVHVSEFITGGVGLAVILLALLHSQKELQKHKITHE